MIRILTIVGARPQFIKAASLSRQIRLNGHFEEIMVHTGQHYDHNMSDVFFNQMQIPAPKYKLGINSARHGDMTGRMLIEIEKAMLKESPDIVLVYGDTNSTLAGAISAAKLQIPVAHVEAGLRSFNNNMPEEINRILTDRVSKYLFCPTEKALDNLRNEGYDGFPVVMENVGDIMYETALLLNEFVDQNATLNLKHDLFILATIHRQENTNDPERLRKIIEALNDVNRSIPVIAPLHPRTHKILRNLKLHPEFQLIEPVGYFDMLRLLNRCQMVITDSGGLQKEAYFFSKHCITLRDETEWVELIDLGVNTLVGTDKKMILGAVDQALKNKVHFDTAVYGSGDTSRRILDVLQS